jgi:hypothetical protein
MNEELLNPINERIEEQMKPFKFTRKILDEMENVFLKNDKYNRATVKIVIKDNKIEYIRDTSATDTKVTNMIEMFKKMYDYVIKNKKKLLDCTIYVFTLDVYTYEYQHLPFFVRSRPSNRTGILIPDESFVMNDIKGVNVDWDQTKDIIKSNCNLEKYDKINKLYFRGSNAGGDKHNIRKLLEKERKYNTFYDITIGQYYVPFYEGCKYKYLLNLPGQQPWSTRFKYLLLMKSLVIHVGLIQNYEFSQNTSWHTFYSILYKKDVDYISIKYDWYENDDDKNKKSLNKLVNEIRETYVYYEDNPDAYDKMVESAYKKVNMMSLDVVYESLFMVINEYAKKFN